MPRILFQFAVMSGKYLDATSCPYLNLKSKNIELTVDIKGHDTPQRNAYDIFEKTSVSLPNNEHRSGRTCAEMYVQGFSLPKAHQGWRERRDLHANGSSVKFDIDDEDMNEKSFEFFRGKGSAADAKTELFRPGEGMALVFSNRIKAEWKVNGKCTRLPWS
jgi:hypothetical protein